MGAGDASGSQHSEAAAPWPIIPQYRFYEKVIKVKDDVAAFLNSFPRAIILAPGRPAGGGASAETKPKPGGSRKGGFSGAL